MHSTRHSIRRTGNLRTSQISLPLSAAALAIFLSGCALSGSRKDTSSYSGTRDNTPSVLVPETDLSNASGNENVAIDSSHAEDGYLCVSYLGDSQKVKFQVTTQDSITYTYNLPTDGSPQIIPLSAGDGIYSLGVYTNVEGTLYATEYQVDLEVTLKDEYLPFLYPNQYVWFTEDTLAVQKASEVAASADTDLDAVSLVYNYVVENMTYDWDKAASVESGYLPDVDAILESGTGICFDYSALMATMLRTQRIPTRLEIGYAGTTYHAWISTYIEDIGWVDGIIQFDGSDWSLMDPTLASTEGSSALVGHITDSNQYRTCYSY